MIIPTIGWARPENFVEAISMFYLADIATMSVIRCLTDVETEVRTRHCVDCETRSDRLELANLWYS